MLKNKKMFTIKDSYTWKEPHSIIIDMFSKMRPLISPWGILKCHSCLYRCRLTFDFSCVLEKQPFLFLPFSLSLNISKTPNLNHCESKYLWRAHLCSVLSAHTAVCTCHHEALLGKSKRVFREMEKYLRPSWLWLNFFLQIPKPLMLCTICLEPQVVSVYTWYLSFGVESFSSLIVLRPSSCKWGPCTK